MHVLGLASFLAVFRHLDRLRLLEAFYLKPHLLDSLIQLRNSIIFDHKFMQRIQLLFLVLCVEIIHVDLVIGDHHVSEGFR